MKCSSFVEMQQTGGRSAPNPSHPIGYTMRNLFRTLMFREKSIGSKRIKNVHQVCSDKDEDCKKEMDISIIVRLF